MTGDTPNEASGLVVRRSEQGWQVGDEQAADLTSAMVLADLLAAADGKTAVVHLVNYSDYPVENVAVHFPAEYKRATLTTPEGVEKPLEVYPTEEGGGVDIDKVLVCATIKLEQ